MAKAPAITPNTPQDVVLRLSQRQAGVSVTQGLLNDIQGIIDSEGPLVLQFAALAAVGSHR